MDSGEDFRSFWSLIENIKIEIPLLQRDYVQGLRLEHNDTVRKELLDSILVCLREDKQLSFDFIYGAKKQLNGDIIFYPLDGQQRLTTLFLLHWYLAVKEKHIQDLSIKNRLRNFSYSSRISSSDFCEQLVLQNFKVPQTQLMSEAIQQTTWFHAQWKFDPTIKAMIVMLDDIHKTFQNVPNVFEKFISNEIHQVPIVFHSIILENLNLTDRIYIKMNARGKGLSAFESFKAWVIQTLRVNNFEKELIIFKEKVETEWTDLFWLFRDVGSYNIDKPFMRYINFICEIKLRIDNPSIGNDQIYIESSETIKYDLLGQLFKNKEQVQFLFNAISILSMNKSTFSHELKNLFTHKSSQIGRLKLFSGLNPNLLTRLMSPNQKLQNDEKTLLYCAILRKMKYPEDAVSLDYLRIIRNLIMRIRQFLYDKYVTNYRAEDFHTIIKFADRLNENKSPYFQVLSMQKEKIPGIAIDSLKEEIYKAELIEGNQARFALLVHKLEDMDLFTGTLNNILGLVQEYPEDLDVFFDSIFNNNKISTETITRGFLALGCDTIRINVGSTFLGPRYVIRGRSSWNNFLTASYTKIQPFLKELFDLYNNNEKSMNGIFEKIIESKIVNDLEKSLTYYLIKYPAALEESDKFVIPRNNLSWSKAHLMSGKNIVAWHALLIHFILERELSQDTDITSFSYGSEVNEQIRLKNGLCIKIEDKGWRIIWPEAVEESERNSLRRRIGVNQNNFLVVQTDEDVVLAGKKLYGCLNEIVFKS